MNQRRAHIVFACIVVACIGIGSCGFIFPSHHRTEDYTPVFAAADACDLNAVRQVVDYDPRLLKATEWDNATLLHDAVGHNCKELVAYLLTKGVDVNAVMDDRVTALHLAAQRGNIPIADLLLQHGANINAIDAKGWTPLDRAEKWKHEDMVVFLRKGGGHEGGPDG